MQTGCLLRSVTATTPGRAWPAAVRTEPNVPTPTDDRRDLLTVIAYMRAAQGKPDELTAAFKALIQGRHVGVPRPRRTGNRHARHLGAFWLGYGLLNLLVTTGALTVPTAAFVCVARRCSPLASGSGRALPLRD
jgi:hypothetical protein